MLTPTPSIKKQVKPTFWWLIFESAKIHFFSIWPQKGCQLFRKNLLIKKWFKLLKQTIKSATWFHMNLYQSVLHWVWNEDFIHIRYAKMITYGTPFSVLVFILLLLFFKLLIWIVCRHYPSLYSSHTFISIQYFYFEKFTSD